MNAALTVTGFAAVLAAVSVALAWSPTMGAAAALFVFVVGAAAYLYPRLPRVLAGVLGVGLIGYAFLGRGFAYVGYPPLFVGEVLLALGILVLVLRGRVAAVLATPMTWPLVVFLGIGAAATLPHLGTYRLDALRDATLWAYGAFAVVVAGLVRSESQVWAVVRRYRALLPFFLVFIPVATVLGLLPGFEFPKTPFSDVSIVDIKGGDVAVHLAGILAFLMLGLHRLVPGDSARRPEWSPSEGLLWLGWLATWLTTLPGRAALLTIGAIGGLVFVLRPTTRWLRLGVTVAVLVLTAFTFDLEFDVGRGRELSPQGLIVAVQSIFDSAGTDAADYDGTRRWRLEWWGDILEYTVLGPYFWTGKGYGINLADADGYQVHSDGSLRSPHNGHMTVLARSGVPGAVAWIALNALALAALARASLHRLREGRTAWSRINLWLAAYWLAFLVNGTFDVYLEGPQGGIWFWCVVGFSLAVLRVQPRPGPRVA